MRHVVVGANGSIGQRHIRNLRTLRPNDKIITVDTNGEADYQSMGLAPLEKSVVYICTPMDAHELQLELALWRKVRAVFVEKPLYAVGREGNAVRMLLEEKKVPIVCGYNFRYNPLFIGLKSRASEIAYLHLYGSEDLAPKYGPTALGTMASHSIDLALWILGEVEHTQVVDIGTLSLIGIRHKSKAGSHICASMLSPFRVATCTVLYAPQSDIDALYRGEVPSTPPVQEHYFLEPNDEMYVDEMRAWLYYVDTGDPGNLCTLDQALAVQKVMQAK